jgi:alkaline phosphatase
MGRRLRRRTFLGGLASAATISATGLVAQAQSDGEDGMDGVENVIVLVGDGMGFDHIQTTAFVHDSLEMESFDATGYTKTYQLDGQVTDSAAAGTALATGFKAYNGQVSVYGPKPDTKVTTLLEVAENLGMSTGLVSTTRITHATPAAYGAHNRNRDNEGEIAGDLVESGAEVLLGGGMREWSDERLSAAEEAGYEVVTDSSELQETTADQLLGLFSDSHVPYVLDRADETPSLTDMFEAAIPRLEGDDGFFMMVEGGRIDHAAHGNDVFSVVAETREFDDVVGMALDYAAENEDTLVVVTSDHETGGMATGDDYGEPIDTQKIRQAEASVGTMASAVADGGNIREVIEDHTDIVLNDEEVEEIRAAKESDDPYALSNAIGRITAKRVGVLFASHKHTAPPQPLMAQGPGEDRLVGWHHHADVSVDLAALTMFGTTELEATNDAHVALTDFVGEEADSPLGHQLDVNDDGLIDYADVLALTERDVPTAGEAEQATETASPTTGSDAENATATESDTDPATGTASPTTGSSTGTATAADNDTETATETPFPTIDPDAGNATTTGNATNTSD